MYFISNIFLRIRGGSKSSCTNAIYFALVQELIDRPSYINEQLLEHDAYISCLQLKKVNVAHDAMHNNYLYNHTAYYHVLQQVIAFLVILCFFSFHFFFSFAFLVWKFDVLFVSCLLFFPYGNSKQTRSLLLLDLYYSAWRAMCNSYHMFYPRPENLFLVMWPQK